MENAVSVFPASPEIRPARPADLEHIATMMRDFYAGEQLPFDEARARRVADELIDPNPYGFLFVMNAADQIHGYLLITWGYGAEYGGPFLVLDEVYLEPAYRGRGWGGLALAFVDRLAAERGAHAVRLEVTDHNSNAARLYQRHGFADQRRRVLARSRPVD